MRLKLNISTCPNDTFMFHAMLHGCVDTEGLEFDTYLADIEQLNNQAKQVMADISKLSYATYPIVRKNYRILNSGSALGRGNGPLLVSKRTINKSEMSGLSVAIPGQFTTANLLINKLFPEITQKKECLFSDVADAVLSNSVDLGVLIHEGRFTYQEKGLKLVADLSAEWEKICGLALPLGAIVVSRNLSDKISSKINRVLRRSIEYAFTNPHASYDFVKEYARELDDNVIRQHIALFVNEFSIDLGSTGREAVYGLLNQEVSPLDFIED